MNLFIYFGFISLFLSTTQAEELETIIHQLVQKAIEQKAKVYEDTILELQNQLKDQESRITQLEKDAIRKDQLIAKLTSTQSFQNKTLAVDKADLNNASSSNERPIPISTTFHAANIVNKDSETALKSAVNGPHKRLILEPEGAVAFHAVIDGGVRNHIGIHQKIAFDNVFLNLGGAFHGQHGLFIAPIKGVYVFSVSIMSYSLANHVEIGVSLVKNGAVLARAYGHGDSGRHDQGSVTVTVQMEVGDEVWVENYHVADDSLWGDRFDSFTGFLQFVL